MIAKFTKTAVSNAVNHGNKKETIDTLHLIAHKKGEFSDLVTVRFYMGRSASASTVFCSICVHSRDKNIYVSGYGQAGGYGYHKGSAAMQDALSSAGIVLFGDCYVSGREKTRHGEPVDYKKPAHIGGVGETAMEDALFALGEALGYTRKQLYICKG